MEKLNQLLDKYNNLTPLKRLIVIAVSGILLIFLLLGILVFITSKPPVKEVLPPIPVFNPSISPVIGPVSPSSQPESSPSSSQLQGLSAAFPAVKDGFIYYLSDGETTLYKASLDGKDKQQLTDPLIAQIKQVIWSKDKSSAILKIENNKYFLGKNNSPFFSQEDDNLAITNWYYNFVDKSYKKLDSRIQPIAYSPDDSKVVYIKEGAGGSLNGLYIAEPDGANEQSVSILPELIQDNLVFLDKDNVLTFATPHGYGRNFIYLTNLTTKQTLKITDDGFTFGANPSPKGNLILAQTVKQDPDVFYKNFLSVINIQDKKLTTLDIQTNLDLTAWSPDGSTIYAFETGKLWLIDADNLTSKSLDLSSEFSNLKIDGGSVSVSSDNSRLFFTSNGKLYNLQVK